MVPRTSEERFASRPSPGAVSSLNEKVGHNTDTPRQCSVSDRVDDVSH